MPFIPVTDLNRLPTWSHALTRYPGLKRSNCIRCSTCVAISHRLSISPMANSTTSTYSTCFCQSLVLSMSWTEATWTSNGCITWSKTLPSSSFAQSQIFSIAESIHTRWTRLFLWRRWAHSHLRVQRILLDDGSTQSKPNSI